MSFQTAITAEEAASAVTESSTVMIGGFMGVGSPQRNIAHLVRRGVRDLTVIFNDTAWPGRGIGQLVSASNAGQWQLGAKCHFSENSNLLLRLRT
jgi:acyl CoA:acetate/3-ketoacid CoA transferase alpha subunit